jgi:hypothetical protein
MVRWIKKYWHDPVWSKVFAGAILAGAAAIGAYFFDWWPIISHVFAVMFSFVLSKTEVPNWLLGFLVLAFLLVIAVIGLLIWNKQHPGNQIPNWRNYTKDTFFDIRWTWRYDETNKVYDLYSFCPHCDFQIYPIINRNMFRDFTHIHFYCESCNYAFGSHSEDIPQFENKVIRHIQRKIRNGSWATNQIA